MLSQYRMSKPDDDHVLYAWRPPALRAPCRMHYPVSRRSKPAGRATSAHRIRSKRWLSETVASRFTENRRIREPGRVALSTWRLRAPSDDGSNAIGGRRHTAQSRRQVGDMSSLARASRRRSRECRGEPRVQPTWNSPRWPLVAEPRVGANRARWAAAIGMATRVRFQYRGPSWREHE
jgi:hypothetical protein